MGYKKIFRPNCLTKNCGPPLPHLDKFWTFRTRCGREPTGTPFGKSPWCSLNTYLRIWPLQGKECIYLMKVNPPVVTYAATQDTNIRRAPGGTDGRTYHLMTHPRHMQQLQPMQPPPHPGNTQEQTRRRNHTGEYGTHNGYQYSNPLTPPLNNGPDPSTDVGEPRRTRSRCTDANAGPQHSTSMEAGIPPGKGEEAHRPKRAEGTGPLQRKGFNTKPRTIARQLPNLSLESNRDDESMDDKMKHAST